MVVHDVPSSTGLVVPCQLIGVLEVRLEILGWQGPKVAEKLLEAGQRAFKSAA